MDSQCLGHGAEDVRTLSPQGTEQGCALDKATCHLRGEPPRASLGLPTCEMGLYGQPRGHSENECDPGHEGRLAECFLSSGKFPEQLLDTTGQAACGHALP